MLPFLHPGEVVPSFSFHLPRLPIYNRTFIRYNLFEKSCENDPKRIIPLRITRWEGMKMEKRKVRFDYFEVVCNGPTTKNALFDLTTWMKETMGKSLKERNIDYKGGGARLQQAYFHKDFCSLLHFCRLRDTNLPSLAKEAGKLEPMELDDDEYLSEEVSGLYDDRHHILMLQRNRYSLSPSGIEEYINLSWNKSDMQVSLRPIVAPKALERIKDGKIYRRVVIRFADLDKVTLGQWRTGTVQGFAKSLKEYGAITAEITVSLGYKKGASLYDETIYDTMEDLQENREFVKKAEVHKKDDEDTAIEVVDLFNDRAYHVHYFPLEKRSSLTHEEIAEKMFEIYSEKGWQIVSYLDRTTLTK